LQNSVTSGVYSGFEQGFIKTNAQIYPGNSGGPLVCSEGRVLGINTFKMLTHKFEGLGFAIPIETALKEFSTYLP
jgi:serine protease Do